MYHPHANQSLTKNYDYERFGVPSRRGNRWYYSHNTGLQAQSIYYSIEDEMIDTKEQGTIFFDPNTLSEDGTVAVFSLWVYQLTRSSKHMHSPPMGTTMFVC